MAQLHHFIWIILSQYWPIILIAKTRNSLFMYILYILHQLSEDQFLVTERNHIPQLINEIWVFKEIKLQETRVTCMSIENLSFLFFM